MTLYEFMNVTKRDFDCADDVFDASVTVVDPCLFDNSNTSQFAIELIKKVDVVEQTADCIVVCKWTDLIKRNMEKFKAFTKEHWKEGCQYEEDEDEFVYQWINEIEAYMAGYVSEDFYDVLVEFVKTLD